MERININDGGGLYDKFGLIDSIVSQLDSLTVRGIGNAVTLCEIYSKLKALKKGLKDEEQIKDGEKDGGIPS